MTDLRELEKRLEEATEGQWWTSEEADRWTVAIFGPKATFVDWGMLTAAFKSLDAAVALVERALPGWGYFIRKDEEGVNASLLYPNALRVSPGCGQHQSSPALALCLALIRALIGDRHE